MRAVDLAIYADTLAGEHSALAARAEQARSRLREAAIERDARAHLDPGVVKELDALGILGGIDERTARNELRRLERALAAVEELQSWVEGRLGAQTLTIHECAS
ncbi:MAG TPA: hypothetical protein VF895_11755 [Gaiellaceae bacterium]